MSGEKVSAGVGGRVVEANVREGDLVRKGDVLMRLDTERIDHEIAKLSRTIEADEAEIRSLERLERLQGDQFATAQAKATADLAQVETEVRRKKEERTAAIRTAGRELEDARREEARTRELVEREAAPRQDLVTATAKLRDAEEKLERARVEVDESRLGPARQALEMVDKDRAVKSEELQIRLNGKRGQVLSAKQGLANLELERAQSVIRAHTDGIVTSGDAKVGDIVDAGKPVFAIAQQKGFRVDAAVASADVGLLRVGMKARIKLDAFDYQKYGTLEGTITTISPDSDMQESGGAKRMVYVVRISLDQTELVRGNLRGQVKFGMMGSAEILTGEETVLSLAVRRFRDRVSTR